MLIAGCKKYSGHDHPGMFFFACGELAEDLHRDVNDRDFDVALHIVFTDEASHERYPGSRRSISNSSSPENKHPLDSPCASVRFPWWTDEFPRPLTEGRNHAICHQASGCSYLLGSVLVLTAGTGARHDDAKPTTGAVEAKQGMVVAVSPLAADVGTQMLRDGGNAVDAAVATAFAEAVTWPSAGNIGGGGFMVIYPHQGDPMVVDYREKAPGAATPTMLQKRDANFAYKTVGVPGTVAGLMLAHQKYGKLRWKHVLEPAIKLAEDGFTIDPGAWPASLNSAVGQRSANAELRRVYGKAEGKEQWKAGDTLRLPDLAWTLSQISEKGPYAFYRRRRCRKAYRREMHKREAA